MLLSRESLRYFKFAPRRVVPAAALAGGNRFVTLSDLNLLLGDTMTNKTVVASDRNLLTQAAALERVLSRGIEIQTVLDLGAAGGAWSRAVHQSLFPEARFHLFEAQTNWKSELESTIASHPQLSFVNAAAAQSPGECFFKLPDSNPFGGRAFETETCSGLTKLPCVSIDSEVSRLNLNGPFFIKFDIHGLENEVLNGATQTLRSTNLIMMEMLFYAAQGRAVPNLMNRLMDLGFHCVDIAEPTFRPYDRTFWQLDMLFVKTERPEIQYRQFS